MQFELIRASNLCLQGDNDDNRNAPNLTEYALQPAPGVYNETIFKTVDFILATADFYDLKVGCAAQLLKLHVPRDRSYACAR